MTAHVTVLYFASLRDAAEVASESFETAAPDLRVLYLELRAAMDSNCPSIACGSRSTVPSRVGTTRRAMAAKSRSSRR